MVANLANNFRSPSAFQVSNSTFLEEAKSASSHSHSEDSPSFRDIKGLHPAHFGVKLEKSASTATQIGNLLLNIHRPYDSALTQEKSCREVFGAGIFNKMEKFIKAEKPIELMIPAFPFKAPDPRKVIGSDPDKAEELSLQFLSNLCNNIKTVYPPGAKIKIYTDGRVFAPVTWGMTDNKVNNYLQKLKNMIEETNAQDTLEVVSLEDFHPGEMDYNEMREKTIQNYGVTIDDIVNRMNRAKSPDSTDAILSDYGGIKQFIEEELLSQKEKFQEKLKQGVTLTPEEEALANASKSKIKRTIVPVEAKKTVQAAETWTKFMETKSPDSIRLSVHPQRMGAEKIGIHINEDSHGWTSPWNATALRYNLNPEESEISKWTLIQQEQLAQHQVKDMCRLAYTAEGKPSHYELKGSCDKKDLERFKEFLFDINPTLDKKHAENKS